MEMTYIRLNAEDLRGTTQADYLIALDADFRVVVGAETIYEDQGFPVVELARSLRMWLDDADRGDFEFDSMSFEEVGSIAFRRSLTGWAVDSIFSSGPATTQLGWAEIEASCRRLIARIEADLSARGIDPAEVLSS